MTPHQPSRSSIPLTGGRSFDILCPESSDFGIEDIALGLSNICRFTGQVPEFYSVAQHSVLVSKAVPDEHAFAGLMHDAAEAFIGDVAKPLKVLLPEYAAIERRVEAAVFERFGLRLPLHPCIKEADRILLRTELRDLFGRSDPNCPYSAGISPLNGKIEPISGPEARVLFLQRYHELAA